MGQASFFSARDQPVAIPGWSFYWNDPDECGSLTADLEASGRSRWAAVEWWLGAADERGWKKRFTRTLGFKQCRYLCVYNWESFRKVAPGLAVVRALVNEYARNKLPTR